MKNFKEKRREKLEKKVATRRTARQGRKLEAAQDKLAELEARIVELEKGK